MKPRERLWITWKKRATAGAWSSPCTTLQVFGPGIKKPGDVVQSVISVIASTNFSTTATAFVTTNASANISPTSPANLVKFSAQGGLGAGSSNNVLATVFRGAAAITNAPVMAFASGAAFSGNGALLYIDAPGTTASTKYAVGLRTATVGSAALFPNNNTGWMSLDEIMG